MKYLIWLLVSCGSISLPAQSDPDYQRLRAELSARFQRKAPGKFASFVRGVKKSLVTGQKIMAFTFDACGGPRRNGYDEELIRFLQQEKIPATLFLTGLWIDEHPDKTRELAGDTLFEIENHGLTHRPCSVTGASRYGIQGTENVAQVVDEIELNARKIEQIGRPKPIFYRPATATCDEACGEVANELDEIIVHYDILSGDAVGGTAARILANNIVKQAHNGAIVIMHMNHPEWNTCEALRECIPKLRRMGYSFVKLEHHSLK